MNYQGLHQKFDYLLQGYRPKTKQQMAAVAVYKYSMAVRAKSLLVSFPIKLCLTCLASVCFKPAALTGGIAHSRVPLMTSILTILLVMVLKNLQSERVCVLIQSSHAPWDEHVSESCSELCTCVRTRTTWILFGHAERRKNPLFQRAYLISWQSQSLYQGLQQASSSSCYDTMQISRPAPSISGVGLSGLFTPRDE